MDPRASGELPTRTRQFDMVIFLFVDCYNPRGLILPDRIALGREVEEVGLEGNYNSFFTCDGLVYRLLKFVFRLDMCVR